MITKGVGLSVKGQRSEENEDAFLVLANSNFYMVADGVGGGPRGREASSMAAKALSKLFGQEVSKEKILSCMEDANRIIKEAAEANSNRGMASTIAAIWFTGVRAIIFNVGDSRVYRFSVNGGLKQLSKDHSKLIEKENKSKNVITKALGVRDALDIEILEINHDESDIFMLMSDGISDAVDDSKISEIASSKHLSLLEKCQALTSEANDNGGKDDKTVVFISVNG